MLIIEDIAREIKQQCHVDLNSFTSTLVLSKITKRMEGLGITVPQTYLDFYRKNPGEAIILLQEIGINVSSFFRNPHVYSVLEQHILPAIIEEKRKKGSKEMRVWSAGCATGEEPYSIAILLHHLLHDEIEQWQIHIFATDIDQEVLTKAAEAVFPRDRLLDTRLGICDNYFTCKGERYTLKQVIRQMVNFSFDDLLSSETIAPVASIFGSFDLVLCRNVMIYFNKLAKQVALRKFVNSLSRKGYLVLGESEWIEESEKPAFIEIDSENRIYKTR